MNENETKPLTEQESVFEEFERVNYNVNAGNWRRFFNHIVDLTMFYIFFVAVMMLFGIFINVTGGDVDQLAEYLDKSPLSYVLSFISATIFYTFMEYLTKGRSVGKFLTKTKVVNVDGSLTTLKSFFIRSLCRFIPFEPFSFFSSKGYGWHDDYSGTRVVKISE